LTTAPQEADGSHGITDAKDTFRDCLFCLVERNHYMKDTYQIIKLKRKYKNEQVLVVPVNQASSISDGFCHEISKSAIRMFKTAHTFVYRYDAEYNYSFVQLIPYVVVTNETCDSLFVTQRIAGEERLISELSLGCGGHVNPQDFSQDTMLKAAMREMKEELDIKLTKGTQLQQYGTVRDYDSTTREHLGLVYLAMAAEVKVKEKDTLSGQWMDMFALVANYHKFESWARHIIDHLFVNHKKSGKLFDTVPLTGAKQHDRKRKKTFRKNC